LSPPDSEHRSSGSGVDNNWAGLATTLKVPGYGQGVESGLEVVEKHEFDDEKMVVGEGSGHIQPTPTASMKSIDYPMRHDSSFYKFGGFCEGARAMIRGDTGFKVVKRPSVCLPSFQHSKLSRANNFLRDIIAQQFQLVA